MKANIYTTYFAVAYAVTAMHLFSTLRMYFCFVMTLLGLGLSFILYLAAAQI